MIFRPFAPAVATLILFTACSVPRLIGREFTSQRRVNERAKWSVAGGASGQPGFVARDCPRRLLHILHGK